METLIYIRRQRNYRSRQTKADNCDFNAVQSFREHSGTECNAAVVGIDGAEPAWWGLGVAPEY